MARNSTCERQLVRAAGDAAFRVLPPMVRLLMLEILAFAAAAPEKGRLRFLGPVSAALSRLLSIPETEVETGLETLAQLGWVEEDAETHSLWVSAARAAAARVEAARANGIRGGRPRKGETPEQYQARKAREREQGMRQGHFMMPIAGGVRVETQETEAEPNAESSRAVLPTTSLSIESSGGSTAREETDLVSLVEDLAATARLSAGRRLPPEPVAEWLDAGVSVGIIRSVVAKLASRPSYDPLRVHTWKFFGPGIEEALAKRPEPQPAAHTPLAEAVHDEDGARAGLDANGQLWVKGWKDARQRGQDTTAKEATMRSVCLAAWKVVQQLKRRTGEGASGNFWPEQRVG